RAGGARPAPRVAPARQGGEQGGHPPQPGGEQEVRDGPARQRHLSQPLTKLPEEPAPRGAPALRRFRRLVDQSELARAAARSRIAASSAYDGSAATPLTSAFRSATVRIARLSPAAVQ